MAIKQATLLIKGGTSAALMSANPILANRELCVETDTKKIKIGNGISHYAQLPYISANASWGNIAGDIGNQVDLQYILTSVLQQAKDYADSLAHLSIAGPYDTLADVPAPDANHIYLIGAAAPYDEYLYVNNEWELIGSTDVDLSDVVDLSSNQTISGRKTFGVMPVLPSSSNPAVLNATNPATEAQVFLKEDRFDTIDGGFFDSGETTPEGEIEV